MSMTCLRFRSYCLIPLRLASRPVGRAGLTCEVGDGQVVLYEAVGNTGQREVVATGVDADDARGLQL